MGSLLAAVYFTVLVAELVGDKTLYTLGTLATRFRAGPILAGASLAFGLKMLAAVLLGRLLAELPGAVVAGFSGATFFSMALAIWLKKPKAAPEVEGSPPRWSRAVIVSFAAIFFPEWGDAGQLTAAMFVAQHRAPALVWAGAMMAMVTKGILAVVLGVGLRRYVPRHVVRWVTVVSCVAMGLLALFRIEI